MTIWPLHVLYSSKCVSVLLTAYSVLYGEQVGFIAVSVAGVSSPSMCVVAGMYARNYYMYSFTNICAEQCHSRVCVCVCVCALPFFFLNFCMLPSPSPFHGKDWWFDPGLSIPPSFFFLLFFFSNMLLLCVILIPDWAFFFPPHHPHHLFIFFFPSYFCAFHIYWVDPK